MNTTQINSDSIPVAADYAVRTERLIEQIKSCPETQSLFESISKVVSSRYEKTGPWSIEFDAAILGHAHFQPSHRRIQLNPACDETSNLTSLLFEMINITNLPHFDLLESLLDEGKIDKEGYAKEVLRIEFKTGLLHHRVALVAIKQMNWPQGIDHYANFENLDFEDFWKYWQFTPHAEAYRTYWEIRNREKSQIQISPAPQPAPAEKRAEPVSRFEIIDIEEEFEEPSSPSSSRFEIIDIEEDSEEDSPSPSPPFQLKIS